MTVDNAIALIGIVVGVLVVAVGALSGFLLSLDRKVNRLEMKDESRAEHIKRLENEALRKIERRQETWEGTMRSLTDFLMARSGKRQQRIESSESDSDEQDASKEQRPW